MVRRTGDMRAGTRRSQDGMEFVYFEDVEVGRTIYLGAHALVKTSRKTAGGVRFDPKAVVGRLKWKDAE